MAKLTPRRCLNVFIASGLILFILGNTQYFWYVKDYKNIRVERDSTPSTNSNHLTNHVQEEVRVPHNPLPDPISTKQITLPKKTVNANEGEKGLNSSESSDAKRFHIFNESLSYVIDDINQQQHIHNKDKFPPPVNGTYAHALVVQVHNRDNYLKHLIRSLQAVDGINSSLLIISHDYYSKEVFDIIEQILFMPVMQIFYPKAMQLYKNKYPGQDPRDCRRDMKKAEAIKVGCINAEHPDLYGHYREAAYSQTKLHWFWKLHHVFENLSVMKGFQGYVTLIEEDHYLTQDALYMLKKMIAQRQTLCPQCRILTLGNYDKKPTYTFTSEVVTAPDFISSKHNMAMSLNHTTYSLIKAYTKQFCDYDDYNWDWSLQYIGKEHIPGRLPTLIVKTPRVYHIGECGVHHKAKKGKKCDPDEKVTPINDLVSKNKDKLYPDWLKLGKANAYTNISIKKMKPNGGWGDIRDRQLCASFMA